MLGLTLGLSLEYRVEAVVLVMSSELRITRYPTLPALTASVVDAGEAGEYR